MIIHVFDPRDGSRKAGEVVDLDERHVVVRVGEMQFRFHRGDGHAASPKNRYILEDVELARLRSSR